MYQPTERIENFCPISDFLQAFVKNTVNRKRGEDTKGIVKLIVAHKLTTQQKKKKITVHET